MSKITNDGLTPCGTGCFIAVSIWQQCASKGKTNLITDLFTCKLFDIKGHFQLLVVYYDALRSHSRQTSSKCKLFVITICSTLQVPKCAADDRP